jgi:hypothetical protein
MKKLIVAFAVVYAIGAAAAWCTVVEAIAAPHLLQASGEVIDFIRAYASGAIVLHDPQRTRNIYDVQVLTDEVEELMAPTKVVGWSKWLYPPYFLAILMPLAYFNIQQAWAIWTVGGAIGTFCALSFAAGRPTDWRTLSVLFCGTTMSFFSWYNFREGQTAVFVMLPMAISFALLRDKRPFLGGVAAAFLLIKPQYAPFPALAGTVNGRLRFVAGFACGALGLVILSTIQPGLVGIEQFLSSFIQADMNRGVIKPEGMENLRGCLSVFLGVNGKVAFAAAALAMVPAAGAVAWLWWQLPRLQERDPAAFDLCAAATVGLSLILSLHAYPYDYMALPLAAFYLWRWSSSANLTESTKRALQVCILAVPLLTWTCYAALPLLQVAQQHGMFVMFVAWLASMLMFRSTFLATCAMLIFIGKQVYKSRKTA